MKGRPLRPGEKALWERVARTVKPITAPPKSAAGTSQSGKPTEVLPQLPQATKSASDERRHAAQPAVRPSPSKRPSAASQKTGKSGAKTVNLRDLDRKERRRLARGTDPIGSKIDLHGFTQEEAHSALVRFIESAQARGLKVVLVITGKGRGETGVLRRAVPSWLSSPALSPLVVGFGAAGAEHGGDGALYVRLRARRRSKS